MKILRYHHLGLVRNVGSCEIKPEIKFRPERDSGEPTASTTPVQCRFVRSYQANWESWSRCEFVNIPVDSEDVEVNICQKIIYLNCEIKMGLVGRRLGFIIQGQALCP